MNNAYIKLGIIHSSQLMSDTLCLSFKNFPRLQVSTVINDGSTVMNDIKHHPCDVLLLDPFIGKKDGIDLSREILLWNNEVKIIVFIPEENWRFAYRLMQIGVKGCLISSLGFRDMVDAIIEVSRGKVFVPDAYREIIMERCLEHNSTDPESKLTNREFQVLYHLAEGMTNGEIAKTLFIGIKTVDTHRANLLRKLSMRNNSDLTRFAIRLGLIEA